MNPVLIVDLFLLVLVLATAIAVIEVRSLFSATMLAGIYSLLMALVWSNMHALDVAFTEAAVGAGISTVLLLGAVVQTGRLARRQEPVHLPALAICIATGAALIYGTFDMPRFGDPNAPIHTHRVPKMLAQEVGKVPDAVLSVAEHPPADPAHPHPHDDFNGHVPNTVTSLLAAYRGFDTMFETTVIYTAGVSLVILLRRRRDEAEEAVEAATTRAPTDSRSAPADDRKEA
ncbi:MAG: DUF4040 domain-containing protein [Myxococcales bacterium FL481]|nr:MAG: DUF4040 domain-containing protein [Myxococcales bacterium FL481]